jgi:glucose/arabinose dehydrogenase
MNLIYKYVTGFFCAVLAAACSGPKTDMTPIKPDKEFVKAVEAFPAIKFASPVDIQHATDGTNRLFVAEQSGVIRVFSNDSLTASSTVFLDIKQKVTSGGERGLLGFAFHPDFKTNGFFYVNYTQGNPLKTVIARYKTTDLSATKADPASEIILLTFNQPYENHNGGSMQFGSDGYLYIATGDGGGGGDPMNHAQNRKSYLGKVLRLDVNSNAKGHYGLPADNPYISGSDGYYPEIFAYGLRNPWKISFDKETGLLLAGDVGQNAREEINVITKGGNYGWPVREGINCYRPSSNCSSAGLTDPILDYAQSDGDKSITGGYIYRGKKVKSLIGKYLYADFVSGRIWSLAIENGNAGANTLLFEKNGPVSTFGIDETGEVYFANYSTGKIMKFAVL